jgi:peptidoglycan/LPS O-acetylase OafA/YrhL
MKGELEAAQVPDPRSPGTIATLELLRGLASLDVFFWHTFNADSGFPHLPGLYRLVDWAQESVIGFFVLSGYVIAISQRHKARGAAGFLKARVKRIVPLYLIALLAGVLVAELLGLRCTAWQVVGHLLFLQSFHGSFVPPLEANGPLWSLGTEGEFYLCLALILALGRPALMKLWWAAAFAGLAMRWSGHTGAGFGGLVLEFLALSPCWLLGYAFGSRGRTARLSVPQAIGLALIVPIVSYSRFTYSLAHEPAFENLKCFLTALLLVPLVHSLAVRHLYPDAPLLRRGWLIVSGVYVAAVLWASGHPAVEFRPFPLWAVAPVPVLFSAASLLVSDRMAQTPAPEWWRRCCLFLGANSYALYVIHTPILFLVIAYVPVLLRFSVLLVAVAVATVFLEYVVQPRMAGWIDRFWNKAQ